MSRPMILLLAAIARRPSNLMPKVANILAWFARYEVPVPASPPASGSN